MRPSVLWNIQARARGRSPEGELPCILHKTRGFLMLYVLYITTTPYLPCNNKNINRKELYDFYYTAITLTTGYKLVYKRWCFNPQTYNARQNTHPTPTYAHLTRVLNTDVHMLSYKQINSLATRTAMQPLYVITPLHGHINRVSFSFSHFLAFMVTFCMEIKYGTVQPRTITTV